MSKNKDLASKEGDTVTLDLVIDDENDADPDNFDESTAREVVCLRILSGKSRFRFGGLEITVKSPAFEVGKTFSVSLDEHNRLAGIESFKQEHPYLPPLYSTSSQGNSSPNDSRTVTPVSSRPSSRRVSLVGSLGLKPARIVVNPSSANENNEGLPWLSARMTLEEDLAAAVQAASISATDSPGGTGEQGDRGEGRERRERAKLCQSPNALPSSQPESENESCNLVASSSNGKRETSKRGSRKGNKSRSERNSSSSGSSKNSSSAWKSNKSPSISSGSLGSSNAPNVPSTSSPVTVTTASNVTSTSPVASGKSSASYIPPGRRSPCSPCVSPATSPSTSPYRRTPSPFKRFFQKSPDEPLRSSTAATAMSSSSESKFATGSSPAKGSSSKKKQKKFVSVGVGTTSNPKESLYFDLERTFRRAKSWKK